MSSEKRLIMAKKVITASSARANIYEPILITGNMNNGFLLSQEDWSAIEETLYLNSISGMTESLLKSIKQSNSNFSKEIEWSHYGE